MHLKRNTCSGHLPIQVQALGYRNTQSLTTSMALMTMETAKCSLLLQHKYVVYSQFKSSSDMKWLVGPAILALLYRLLTSMKYKILYVFLSLMLVHISYDFFGQNSCVHVNKYMHIVQTELILMAFFCFTQYYCAWKFFKSPFLLQPCQTSLCGLKVYLYFMKYSASLKKP